MKDLDSYLAYVRAAPRSLDGTGGAAPSVSTRRSALRGEMTRLAAARARGPRPAQPLPPPSPARRAA